MQREQFQSKLDSELRVWLIDQKPKNLSQAARLADQYVAVRKADRPMYKGHSSPSKGHATKPKPFGAYAASGHSSSSGGFQKSTSTGYNAKPHTEQKPSTTSTVLLVPKAIILIIPEPEMYATIVRNLGTSWLTVTYALNTVSVSRKRLLCS